MNGQQTPQDVEQGRAAAATAEGAMLPIKGLAYTKVSDVPLGHLVLCLNYAGAAAELALRVEAPGDHAMDKDGVLFLRSNTQWGEVGAVVCGKYGGQVCLDLGVPTFAIPGGLAAAAISQRSHGGLGTLALHGQTLMILAAFGHFGRNRSWWDVTSGKQVACEQRVLFERWCVGLYDLHRKFVPQLRFPEDFRRDAPAQ